MLDTLATWSTALLALVAVVIPFPGRTARLPRTTKRIEASIAAGGIIRPAAAPLSNAQHFTKIAHVISGAAKVATQIGDLHEKARVQLEVVEITMDRLLEDVADVMSLPPSLMPRGTPAMATIKVIRRAA